jgi:hypothetical protein
MKFTRNRKRLGAVGVGAAVVAAVVLAQKLKANAGPSTKDVAIT